MRLGKVRSVPSTLTNGHTSLCVVTLPCTLCGLNPQDRLLHTVQGNWKSARDGDKLGVTRASGDDRHGEQESSDASTPGLTLLPPARLANTIQARTALADGSCLGPHLPGALEPDCLGLSPSSATHKLCDLVTALYA